MVENIKPLIVVLLLALPAFYIGRRIANSTVSVREFGIWRNAWLATTIVAFLSPNFIVFVIVEAMLCLYLYTTSSVTVALFTVLLFAVPPVTATINILGAVNNLIELNNARFLAIALLFPVLFLGNGSGRQQSRIVTGPDWLIVGYVFLMVALQFRQANITSVMRAATELTLDILIPYFAFSRAVKSLADFRKVCLAFVIALIPLSLIAMAEAVKGWPLYDGIVQTWGGGMMMGIRAGMLRGGATAGSIPLGFIIMVAIGCMLAVWDRTSRSNKFVSLGLAILVLGLCATLSRGPWVGTAVLLVIFILTGQRGAANLAIFAVIGAAAGLFLLQIPIVQKMTEFLPFIGSVDAGNVTYRQDLFDKAMPVIERNLWLGSVDYRSTPELQSMVQGQGMVDIVNTYLEIALNTGLIGLSMFLAFFATIMASLWRVFKTGSRFHLELRGYARASIATLIAILATIGTVSSVSFIPYAYWSFSGLCVALARVAHKEQAMARLALQATGAPA